MEKITTKQPEIGDVIRMMFLPCIHPGEKSAYIGMTGTVEEVYTDGGFTLKSDGNTLYVLGSLYSYIKI